MLTGGRNIANDYFDLSDHYNFLDSDLEVSGPIGKTVLDSFDVYWNSYLSTDPVPEPTPNPEAEKFVLPIGADLALFEKLRAAGESYRQSHKTHEGRDLRFVTDFPNHGEASRKVFVEELGRAKQEAVVESPYLVINSGGYDVLEDLHNRSVHVRVLTNSLASTDAAADAAHSLSAGDADREPFRFPAVRLTDAVWARKSVSVEHDSLREEQLLASGPWYAF